MYTIDLENRQVIINAKVSVNKTIIKEFDKINRKFLQGTSDTYECILVLKEVPKYDENFNEIGVEVKAFAQRVDNPSWLMEFNIDEYDL